MLRKKVMAALAVAAVGLAAPQAAQARGGFWPGVAIGAGIAGAGYYGPYGYGYPYYGAPYYYGLGYEDYGAQCYPARQRVMTQWGWRVRRVQVCE
ncbi:hypothetical protein ACFQZO_33735 [Bradyrhizobium sp. GCM10027634]|uniref:hypothetical protein n=1 Tax=unclassified Bradyrhizobium TaxID=2631580 RepID=UPI00188A3FBF|nr:MULTISPECIES: hypothetical protein [unclassified Bradyrhizobium]MDN5005816.1 hypothetical protein [Bradyrhizobium sp. WYCCWR 12677]QOZ44417.1 hypothetical protein XH89_13680 [Bradyrhizobium sp. CCBAU 53340]